MRSGRLFHRITFFAKVTTRGDYSDSVDTWPLATINTRGDIIEVGGNKENNSDEKFYSKQKEITVRYNPDIIETMRIQIDGDTARYAITYIEEIQRHKGFKLTVEKINT